MADITDIIKRNSQYGRHYRHHKETLPIWPTLQISQRGPTKMADITYIIKRTSQRIPDKKKFEKDNPYASSIKFGEKIKKVYYRTLSFWPLVWQVFVTE